MRHKNKNTRALSLILILSIMLNFSGCWDRRELNSLAIVMGFGIDKAEAPDEVTLTVQIVKSGAGSSQTPNGGKSDENSSYINICETGKNTFAIIRDFTHKVSRKLYIGHNELIVFGEDLAKQGIRDNLDIFIRDHEGRMTVNLFVARGYAKSIFEVTPAIGKITSGEIGQLMDGQRATSESVQLTLADVVADLTSTTKSMTAPYLDVSIDCGKEMISINGTAVFKDDKLVGSLDKKETRGYMWAVDKIKSGIVSLEVLGETADIEIKKASGKIQCTMSDKDSISINILVDYEFALGSQTGDISLNDVENTPALEKAASDTVKAEILRTLNRAKEMGTDIYGFGERIMQKYPEEWKGIESDWDELFKNLTVNVEVSSKLRGGGRIVNPIYPEKELNK